MCSLKKNVSHETMDCLDVRDELSFVAMQTMALVIVLRQLRLRKRYQYIPADQVIMWFM